MGVVSLLQKWLQFLTSSCVHNLCNMTLEPLPKRGGIHFPIWTELLLALTNRMWQRR